MNSTEKSALPIHCEHVAPNDFYAIRTPHQSHPIAEEEFVKIHPHLSRCDAYTSANLLKAGARVVGETKIRRVRRRFVCRGVVGRITPPEITGRKARINGEIIGIDVIYPFVGCKEGIEWDNFTAILIADCVARFSICS